MNTFIDKNKLTLDVKFNSWKCFIKSERNCRTRQTYDRIEKTNLIHSAPHQTTQQTDDLQYFQQCLPSTLALTDTNSYTFLKVYVSYY